MDNQNINVNNPEDTKGENEKTYTVSEVEQLLQSEVDRRMTQAQKKWAKQQQKEIAEAERLSKMSAEEQQQERIKALQTELSEREKALNLKENKIACLKIMDEQSIPTAFIDFIVSDDADEMNDRIKTFKKTLDKMIADEVTKRIGGIKPSAGTKNETMTKESFKKLSLAEQQRLFEQDRELFNKFN